MDKWTRLPIFTSLLICFMTLTWGFPMLLCVFIAQIVKNIKEVKSG